MSDTSPGPEEVRHVARLARVAVSDEDAERFADQFEDILGYFETLDEVPAVERESDLVNVMREDEIRDGLEQEDALANAPESEDGYFKGPNVS